MTGGEFTRKKIDSLTLGEKMKRIRSERRLSLHEISKGTKIQSKYLEYLEEGLYEKLPADVYVRGFLKSYADYVGINDKALIKLFERESGVRRNIKKIESREEVIKPLKITNWLLTPRIIAGFLAAILVFFGFFYLYREVDKFTSTPKLIIVYPADGETIEGRVVSIKGFTEADSRIFINNQAVAVDENGGFQEDINLQPGLNSIVVRSVNKFDKESTRSFSVQARIEESETQVPLMEQALDQTIEKKLLAEIVSRDQQTWISIKADGHIVFSGVIFPDSPRTFEAKEEISITSANGRNTLVKINGREKGPLSEKEGIVREVIFRAEENNQ